MESVSIKRIELSGKAASRCAAKTLLPNLLPSLEFYFENRGHELVGEDV